MPPGQLQLVRVIPGAATLRAALRDFCREGPVVITALSDSRLRVCQSLAPANPEADVIPFGEAVGRFLALAGGRSLGLAQSGHVRAAVVESCRQLPADSPFHATAERPGLHKRLMKALEEFRSWGLEPEDIEGIIEKLDAPLAAKLKSLVYVEREIRYTLGKLGRQLNSQRMKDCLDVQPEEFDRTRLVVYAGSQDEPLDLDWLKWAACEMAVPTTVLVEHHPGDDKFFLGARAVEERLGGATLVLGKPNLLAAQIFAAQPAEKGQPVDVEICRTSDPLAEAEWALRGCLEAMERGVPPTALAIHARDQERYAPLVEAAAHRLGVPVRVHRRVPLLSNALARFFMSVLEFCASEDVRTLRPLLASSYLGLTFEHRRMIGAAIKDAYLQREGQWEALCQWAELQREEHGWLADLLAWRKEVMQQPAPLADWHSRLSRLGEQHWNRESLDGPAPSNDRDRYAQNALLRALAQVASIDKVRDNAPLPLHRFVNVCRGIWSQTEVSLPANEFGISLVSSADEIADVEELRVLGMLEGVFPRRRSEDPILTDSDRQQISDALPHMPPLRDSHRRAKEEREEFYRICCTPTRRLVLSYPLTDEDRDNVPAFYLTEVQRLLSVKTTDFKRSQLTPEEPVAEADRRLKTALETEPKERPLIADLLTETARRSLQAQTSPKNSPAELTEALHCPFRYTFRRRLGVRSSFGQSRWYRLLSLPERARLVHQATEEEAVRTLEAALEVELSDLYGEATETDLALMRAGGKRLIREWVEREFEARKLWPRETTFDRPTGFDDGDLKRKLPLPDGELLLTGKVPAISIRDGYKTLHLFMSGDPMEDSRGEERAWRQLHERHQLEFALYLLALKSKDPQLHAAIEVDSASGVRRLIMTPRPTVASQRRPGDGYHVHAVDTEFVPEMTRFVLERANLALKRIRMAAVEPTPGEYCRTCDYGELCRRHSDWGEEPDLFANPEGGPAADD
jgi:hypothetical protein